jgi:hypothetical protein
MVVGSPPPEGGGKRWSAEADPGHVNALDVKPTRGM